MTPLGYTQDDGGRKAAGRKGSAGDCTCRAIAIAARLPYATVYDRINELARAHERPGARKGRQKGKRSSARTGVYKSTIKRYLTELGFTWVPRMAIGQGFKTHMRADELPRGRLVVSVTRHMVAVIDHVVHDTHDPRRDGTRGVYGYWVAPEQGAAA